MQAVKIFLVFALFANNVCADQNWQLIPQDSKLSFTASYDEIPFAGEFERFTLELNFDPKDPANSKLKTQIDVTSVNTNSRDRDEALADRDWFYFEKFPQATFTSEQISKLETNSYKVTGVLKIRDQERQVSFPFRWQPKSANRAQATAEIMLDRRDFAIGSGDWAEDETIGFSVAVKINLLLEAKL